MDVGHVMQHTVSCGYYTVHLHISDCCFDILETNNEDISNSHHHSPVPSSNSPHTETNDPVAQMPTEFAQVPPVVTMGMPGYPGMINTNYSNHQYYQNHRKYLTTNV